MKKIAIIGAGELGSRHLQALAKHKSELAIYLVDPSQSSLELSEKRFNEVNVFGNKNLYLKSKIAELPIMIEFVVISTNSIQRLNVLKELLNHSKVKYLVLEKFLFPKEEEYLEASNIIKDKNVSAYVNCARRMWPNYQNLKREIFNESSIELTVVGSNWNLASNAIHFLDLFFFLCGEEKAEINIDGLSKKLLENKRKGYIEVSGTLRGRTEKGNVFRFTSSLDTDQPISINIVSKRHCFIISESEKKVIKDNYELKVFKSYFQSELTHRVFEQLMDDDTCDLVEFDLSAKYHMNLLKAFNEFLNGREGAIT